MVHHISHIKQKLSHMKRKTINNTTQPPKQSTVYFISNNLESHRRRISTAIASFTQN
eukprot:c17487_g1_i1 orf=33-203(+)